jgi:hypothetical protein
MSEHTFEKIEEMKLNHLPNDAKLVIQRQRSDVIGKKIQMYLATTFVNSENSQIVWNKGFSIQLEQIPQLVEMLQKTCAQFKSCERTVTFADMIQ